MSFWNTVEDILFGTPAGQKPPVDVPGITEDVTQPFESIGSAINSVGDFLKFIAWIFHPANILRVVEFIIGIALMGYGLSLAIRPRHGQPRTNVFGSLLDSTPFIGRKRRERQGRQMGTREGQRESARMRARQEVTREARTESANERARITLDSRRIAREGSARSHRVRGHA